MTSLPKKLKIKYLGKNWKGQIGDKGREWGKIKRKKSGKKQDWKFQSIARDDIVKIGQDWNWTKLEFDKIENWTKIWKIDQTENGQKLKIGQKLKNWTKLKIGPNKNWPD